MATYILNEDKMFCDIADGIAIVINSETGIYYGMNEFGTAVFENIINGAETDAILAAIQGIPDAPDNMRDRMEAFIGALLAKELIFPGDAHGEVNLNADIAKGNDFMPEVKEYNDAQELLLADPIHEVNDGTGWTPEKDSLKSDTPDEK